MYKLSERNRSMKEALKLSQEFDYNLGRGKIPLGIFYKHHRNCLHEEWPQLEKLRKSGKGWKGVKR